jgi:hypothetical protein
LGNVDSTPSCGIQNCYLFVPMYVIYVEKCKVKFFVSVMDNKISKRSLNNFVTWPIVSVIVEENVFKTKKK